MVCINLPGAIVLVARNRKNKQHQLAVEARERVATIIDQVPAGDLVNSIKRAPSLRGMILGYIAEEMFQRHILEPLSQIEGIVISPMTR